MYIPASVLYYARKEDERVTAVPVHVSRCLRRSTVCHPPSDWGETCSDHTSDNLHTSWLLPGLGKTSGTIETGYSAYAEQAVLTAEFSVEQFCRKHPATDQLPYRYLPSTYRRCDSLGLAGLVRMSGCSCFPAKLRARAFAMARACHRSRFTSRSLLLLARSEPPHITKSTHAPRPNMSESDEEADLKRALAMSLGHHSTGEEDEEDLAQAIALSLQESEQQVGPKSPVGISNRVTTQVEQSDEASTAVGASLSNSDAFSRGLGGMDRKAMEEERLARQRKRKHISSPEQPVKRLTPASDGTEKQKNKIAAQSSPSVVLQYPRGAIKRTFAHAYPRTNDISIDELLQTPSIHMAVISSFMWDADWLHKKLDPIKVKQIWVMNAKGKDVQKRWLQEMKDTGVPNLTLHFPPMHGMIQSMHSKFLLLFGKKKLRFAVPTANMTCIDWGEVANDWQPGVMENSVFLIDLPRLADGVSADHAKLTKFGKELIYFLEQQELPRKVIDGVLNFDFSETAHLAFVHSIGGSHDPTTAHPTGLPGLAAAVRGLNLGNVNNLEIDYAASSIGAVNDNLLQQLHMAARGKDSPPVWPNG
ncbi:hypothetical protein LEMA_P077980.1 [Plenodomus lingam JN3]|uniref:Uncharacterized protein n=1 Tax=Leptosphaeria maculans (strain JN3 / isolate v23.1.3 / race Av1-4-5-6-7-8) TaxID=985895 RepID=E5A4L1_LEPMJ|nr:hypothetical protein LEMA_P077980.1 [Plenodomus lingam JN3]CBX98559.1 hypothetical protein LEMA_P077980.1 [Plenodomus lingam JN3]